jgi:hypothetical protein
MDTYLCTGQYIFCVLDTLYIIYLCLILLQIFSKCHTEFFDTFCSIFTTFSPLRLKQQNEMFGTLSEIHFSTKNRPVLPGQTDETGAHGSNSKLIPIGQVQRTPKLKQKDPKFVSFVVVY